MKIIALRGRANSGKSATIRVLNDLFIQNGYQVISTTFNKKGGDFRTVFMKNKKLIGITSSGDTYDIVLKNLTLLIDDYCTICVCACRTSDRGGHGTNAAIDEFRPNYQKQYINKTVVSIAIQEQQANLNDAQILFNTVNALV